MPDLGPTLSLPVPTETKEKVLRIAEIMANRPIGHVSNYFKCKICHVKGEC